MNVVRWTIPSASVSSEVAERLMSWDGSTHKIFATGDPSTLHARRDGDNLVVESHSVAPVDFLKSHLRYMVAFGLGGKEAIEQDNAS